MEYYDKSLKLKGKQKDIDGCIRIFYNKGLIFFNLQQYEKSLKYYYEALDFNMKIERSAFLEHRILQNIAHVYKHTGEYEKAIKIILNCIDYFYKTNNRTDRADSMRVLAGLYVRTQKFDLAEKYFKEAEELAKELNSKRLKMLINSELQEYCKELKDFKNALISARKYYELNRERNITIEKENIRKLNILHTVDLTKKETQVLTEKNEELKLLNNKLIRFNEEKNYFMNVAANDLKAPLQNITDKVNFIKSENKTEQIKHLSEILVESSYMQKVISDLLIINELDTVK